MDSAGTSRWEVGKPAHPGTLAILRKLNIPYDGRARQIEHSDLNDFDYVLAMDRDNLAFLLRYSSGRVPRFACSCPMRRKRGWSRWTKCPTRITTTTSRAPIDWSSGLPGAAGSHPRNGEGLDQRKPRNLTTAERRTTVLQEIKFELLLIEAVQPVEIAIRR